MSAMVSSIRQRLAPTERGTTWAPTPPLLALAALLALMAVDPAARTITLTALSEAYLAVSVFVAATLAAAMLFEAVFKVDLSDWLARRTAWQIPIAAFLGALPGCGGAVIVVTQYMRGSLGFGSLIAVLTSTMGDAAFLLLAREPGTAALVFGLSLVVGVVSGVIVERLHGRDFLRADAALPIRTCCADVALPPRGVTRLWLAIMAPGLVVGLLLAFQVDTDALLAFLPVAEPTLWLGVAGAALSLLIWAGGWAGANTANADGALSPRVVAITCFVTVWVVAGFLVYELGSHYSGIDIGVAFKNAAVLLPLIGVLVGLLPGCGPAIVVTTLYLTGAVPMSTLLGNAIGNDGDALFPAMAMAPKAAVIATLYTAIPAVIVAYGAYGLDF